MHAATKPWAPFEMEMWVMVAIALTRATASKPRAKSFVLECGMRRTANATVCAAIKLPASNVKKEHKANMPWETFLDKT